MQPRKHLLATCSVLLIAALLAACAAPAAAPTATPAPPPPTAIPPAPTPVPSTPEPAAAEAPETTVAAESPLVPHQPRPDAPPYGQRGPYAVGVRDFVIDTPERQIPVTVWYPASNPEGLEEAVTYTMDFLADPTAGFPTGGRALRDAAPNPAGGPYPLVLYSHGAWCYPAIASFLLEHLASHGFVVMAAVHEDNWGTLMETTYKSEISRSQDMVRQLDFAEELTKSGGELASLIGMEHVAVTGQSFGGTIALEMGGARINVADWQETYCVDFPDDEDCKVYPDHFEEMAKLAGLDAVPVGLWPDWSDPRIDAVVATAPGVSMLGGGGLDGMRRPFMLLIGTNDTGVGPMMEYRKGFETILAAEKTRVQFEGAGHMIFGNACEAYPGMVDIGLFFVCADPVWDMNRAQDLTNHFVTAFLLAELKGDAEAAAALAPENVTFPGIRYETTGYGAAPAIGLDAATTAEIDAFVEEIMASNQLPGLALGVVKDGELVYAKGFGVTSLEGGEPVTPQTVFQWNETAMAPTAMAVLQLVDAGKIDLDAPVTDYLPDFQMKDERYRDITAGQLLAHRSGIADSSALRTNSGNAMADWENLTPEFDDAAIDRWVRSLADQELVMAPGSGFEYSDQGYALLGAVIGAASGQSYEAYMEENILGPLGMDNSTFLLEEVDKAMLAAPYVTKEGNLVVSTVMPYHRPFAAANNLFASIEDMAKLAQVSLNRGALDDQRILPEGAVDQMWEANGQTPFADFPFGTVYPSNMMSDWGYGWFLGDVDGHRVASTVGGDYGYNGSVAVAPDAALAVMVVGNRDLLPDGYFANDTVTDVMAMLLEGLEPEPAAALGDATAAAPAATPVPRAYVEVNGTRLYYEMAGAGEPIVMIHGLGWDTRSWDNQFAELAQQYQVMRYDMRGFGQSDMPTDQPYAHADDLKALLEYLEIDAAHIFGHSFGGEIAINFALAYPEATRSLVLIEPDIQGAQGLPDLTPEEEASFAAVFEALDKGDNAAAGLAIVDMHPLVAVSRNVPGVRELILQVFTDYQWWQFLNEDPVVQPDPPPAERIGDIAVPTLLVVGDATTEYQKIEVDRLAEQVPKAEKVVFENSDHFPHLLYPREFNSLVLDFLARVSGRQ